MSTREKIQKPNITFYGLFELREGAKTPIYELAKCVGTYAPLEALRNKRDKKISLYLDRAIHDNPNAPALRLHKNSLNVTGLKDLFINRGGLSGCAYGYPPATEFYGEKEPKPNPFFCYCTDAFLFVIHYNQRGTKSTTPRTIEMLVLEGARVLIPLYAKQLQIGGFDADLERLRDTAAADPAGMPDAPGNLF